jgi:hypothetical protein
MASSTVVSVCNAPTPSTNNPSIGAAAPTEPTLSVATTAVASSIPSLSQLSTASGASVDLDDGEEFSSDNNNNRNNKIDNDYEQPQNQSNTASSTSGKFWDLFLSLYLPVLLVWMRRSMFGTMNLFRSLFVGHCLRLLFFGNASEWMTEKAPWLQSFLFQQATTSINGKVDPRAWPPPALTVLAILTIVALVVHPDGCTWIVLGKLR